MIRLREPSFHRQPISRSYSSIGGLVSHYYHWFRPSLLDPHRFAAFAETVERMYLLLSASERTIIVRKSDDARPPLFSPQRVTFTCGLYAGIDEAIRVDERAATCTIEHMLERVLGIEGFTARPAALRKVRASIVTMFASLGIYELYERWCQTNQVRGYDPLAGATALALHHHFPEVWVNPGDLGAGWWEYALHLYRSATGSMPDHMRWVVTRAAAESQSIQRLSREVMPEVWTELHRLLAPFDPRP